MSDERAALDAAATTLGLILDGPTQDRLLRYLALLRKWNRVYNLTAVRDPAEMLTHHLFDSLTIVPPLRRELSRRDADAPMQRPAQLLDVGSGAGLPGVVVAIVCPDVQVTCVDAVAKKAAFIQQVAAELELGNLVSTHGRVESLGLGAGPGASSPVFDVISARAVASLQALVAASRHLLRADGCWLAMKAKPPTNEIAKLPPTIEVLHVEQLTVPGLDAKRCIVWMRPHPRRLSN